MKKLNQAGDTLVEVMLSVAIIGLVIGASYATSSRALRTGRYAQEQTEALKQAESQIEKLKYIAGKGLASTNPNYIFKNPSGTFCISDAPYTKVRSTDANYAATCKGLGNSALYSAAITYTAVPAAPDSGTDLFKVNITWQRESNAGTGTVQISYRLHNKS